MKKRVVLIIRDGWGIGRDDDKGNAVAAANTPNTDSYLKTYPNTQLGAAGEHVGLSPGFQGSSEVGHLNMGAGRLVEQEINRLNNKIKDGSFFKNAKLLSAFENCKTRNSSLHLMGLVQDQGVHAVEEHLYVLLEFAKKQNMKNVYVHFFADGRDTLPRSAMTYLKRLESKIKELNIGIVASVTGRYYAMDRDTNWERTKLAYEALTSGKGLFASSPQEAINAAYSRADETLRDIEAGNDQTNSIVETDEFIQPTLMVDDSNNPVGCIKPGDSVIFFNYRQDRAFQLAKAFNEDEFDGFERGLRLDVNFIGLTPYYDSFKNAIIEPMNMANILGEVLAKSRVNQLRISETQKFRHVTSFFNSKIEKANAGEERILIDSPKVAEDKQPEMSAYDITDVVVNAIKNGISAAREHVLNAGNMTLYKTDLFGSGESGEPGFYDVIIINYVNGDMVGHTGVFNAAKKAIEVVDECLGKVVKAALEQDCIVLITADHGNAEQMLDPASGEPQTAHTTNDVEFIYIANKCDGIKLKSKGNLSNISPTILEIMGIDQPVEMTAVTLLEKS